MLKHLQKSVEEEEVVWKSKMADSEEQLRLVRCLFFCLATCHFFFISSNDTKISLISTFQALEKVSKMEAENQSVEQVRMFSFFFFFLKIARGFQAVTCSSVTLSPLFLPTVKSTDDASGSPA